MSFRRARRDSDVILSNFNHKELLFKFLIIGDYGVGEYEFSMKSRGATIVVRTV